MARRSGGSTYHALNVKVQKRFTEGVMVLAAYTWSSNWDNIWGAYRSSTRSTVGITDRKTSMTSPVNTPAPRITYPTASPSRVQ